MTNMVDPRDYFWVVTIPHTEQRAFEYLHDMTKKEIGEECDPSKIVSYALMLYREYLNLKTSGYQVSAQKNDSIVPGVPVDLRTIVDFHKNAMRNDVA